MTTLNDVQTNQGAQLAPDNIPLHFGDQQVEYDAAQHRVALFDRSHEGRIQLTGNDRLEIIHRISTNDLHNMTPGEGRATVFTKANARIIDRLLVYNLPDTAFGLTEPGRGAALAGLLQKQIFFNDDATVTDITGQTAQFTLHGPAAADVLNTLDINADDDALRATETTIGGADVIVARKKPLLAPYWSITVLDKDAAGDVWQAISAAGEPHGLQPAGSLTFNVLRIQSGRPAVGRELTPDYLPIEVGLWDEVSFSKGCYTGQEILARMESRNRVAKVLVRLQLRADLETPAPLLHDGRNAGTVTSSVTAPDGNVYAVGVVKTKVAMPDAQLITESGDTVTVIEHAAAAPPPVMLGG